jgi:hypothetical protein
LSEFVRDGSDFGEECLSLRRGHKVQMRQTRSKGVKADAGGALGVKQPVFERFAPVGCEVIVEPRALAGACRPRFEQATRREPFDHRIDRPRRS